MHRMTYERPAKESRFANDRRWPSPSVNDDLDARDSNMDSHVRIQQQDASHSIPRVDVPRRDAKMNLEALLRASEKRATCQQTLQKEAETESQKRRLAITMELLRYEPIYSL